MVKLLIILLVALYFEAVGVVFLSKGLKQLDRPGSYAPAEMLKLVGRGAQNRSILLGILFEAIFFFALLFLISRADVSLVWPLTSLSFVFTAIAAKFFLNEHVSGLRWGGVFLIMCGAAMIIYSERVKSRAPAPSTDRAVLQDAG